MQHTEAHQPAAKKESLLGICQAIGDDFGFNPDILRVALAFSLLVDAKTTIIGYALAGVVVLTSRLVTRPSRWFTRTPARSLIDA
jgi:phage shock protein C